MRFIGGGTTEKHSCEAASETMNDLKATTLLKHPKGDVVIVIMIERL